MDAQQDTFFDTMLMFGWTSERRDSEIILTNINYSLEDWIKFSHPTGEEFVKNIKDGQVNLEDFFSRVLHPDHEKFGQNTAKYLKLLIKELEENYKYSDFISRGPNEWEDINKNCDENDKIGIYRKRIKFLETGTGDLRILAGVRTVLPEAIKLNFNCNIPNSDGDKRNRVDLISVCRVERDNDGFRVTGLQGQLQQAWQRVKSIIHSSTQTGAVGLIGRSMSHNLGSHALFWLESNETSKNRKILFRYLRERMELVAGFATKVPLSTTSEQLKVVVKNFNENSDLLETIVRSEGIEKVSIEYKAQESADYEIAMPGGVLGCQALYLILENNIRDSAKHAKSSGDEIKPLEIDFTAEEPEAEYQEDFIKIIVSDRRGNFEKAKTNLEEPLKNLRVADEFGNLVPGDWGVKERFISAALLRGIRLENIPIETPTEDGRQFINWHIGDYQPKGQPRILDITNVNGNLGWVFYLMKTKDILLVKDDAPPVPEVLKHSIDRRTMKWLVENANKPSKIRHRFVVICPRSQEDFDHIYNSSFSHLLPYRVFVNLPDGLSLPADSCYELIDEDSLQFGKLSCSSLANKWLERLAKNRGIEVPELVFLNGAKLVRKIPHDNQLKWEITKYTEENNKNAKVAVFDKHGYAKEEIKEKINEDQTVIWGVENEYLVAAQIYYEPYKSGDLLYSQVENSVQNELSEKKISESLVWFNFAESVLTKIMVLDERLDTISEILKYSANSLWKCSLKELFKWKGIDIKGKEFAVDDDIPELDTVIEWLKKDNPHEKYDFLIIHKGIIDKLRRVKQEDDSNYQSESKKDQMLKIIRPMQEHVRQVIVHSGRMDAADLPDGVKFMALSNLDLWIKNNYSKSQITEDLYLWRRV